MMESKSQEENAITGIFFHRMFPPVGRRIRRIRGNLTQSQFGEVVGVSQGAIAKYEKGRIPRSNTLLKIADLGNVSIDWLLTGNESIAEQNVGGMEAPFDDIWHQTGDQEIKEIMKELERNPELKRGLLQILRIGKTGEKLLQEICTWNRKRIDAFFVLYSGEGNI